ncbi:MAG: hypothetical protein A2622_09285 [Bdellovibrionales bacterium RIFCSPHIGHO2_01_FULL_40_29]|nr:MAG: hypothetical protein A2622_09285 [Bdellovibrionales bacterium RIFCSPHIGHO2_01_FULL_40_29]OFZ33604.1 MAG: hypothetical protein A3D17_00340 [Bdellovibrionales bacterium RIFCSPHIGHO2_02_FULL_40_15]
MSVLVMTLILGISAYAEETPSIQSLDELNPFAENIESLLNEMDQDYELETGRSAFEITIPNFTEASCKQKGCEIYAQIVKSEQKLYLYIQGILQTSWSVSTGLPKYETPHLNTHPNGRIYDAYTSKKFPGGDYKGLGNMPYAVFIEGGFAIHGTAESNWPKLGRKASHGCIRIHPDNALYFNRLVREAGVRNTWVSVQE